MGSSFRVLSSGDRSDSMLHACVAILFLAALCAVEAATETLLLRDGETIEGEVLGAREEGLRVRTDGIEILVDWEFFDPPEAFRLWRGRVVPNDVNALRPLARFADRHAMTESATEVWQRIVDVAPDDAEARNALGFVREGTRWAPKSEAAVDAATGRDNLTPGTQIPARAVDQDRRGEQLMETARKQQGDAIQTVEEAIACYKKAIGIYNKYPQAHYHLGIAYQYTQTYDEAKKALEKALQLNPDFHEALVELGDVYAWMGNYPESIKKYDEALALAPTYALAFRNKALIYLRTHKPAEAQTAIKEALRLDPKDQLTGVLNPLIDKEVAGPGWATTFTRETEHFIVSTDQDQETADFLADHAEKIYGAYATLFPKKTPETKFPILVFTKRDDYVSYGAPANSGGYYSSLLRKLVFFRQEKDEDTLIVLYHEGFHQFLNMYIDDAPIWFNEGHADYFGPSKHNPANGRMYVQVNPWRLQAIQGAIRSQRTTPLPQLLLMTQAEMYDPNRVGLHYAQAWSFVYFLWEYKGAKYSGLLRKYYEGIRQGIGLRRAYDATFGKLDMTKLEKEWKDFILTLQ